MPCCLPTSTVAVSSSQQDGQAKTPPPPPPLAAAEVQPCRRAGPVRAGAKGADRRRRRSEEGSGRALRRRRGAAEPSRGRLRQQALVTTSSRISKARPPLLCTQTESIAAAAVSLFCWRGACAAGCPWARAVVKRRRRCLCSSGELRPLPTAWLCRVELKCMLETYYLESQSLAGRLTVRQQQAGPADACVAASSMPCWIISTDTPNLVFVRPPRACATTFRTQRSTCPSRAIQAGTECLRSSS